MNKTLTAKQLATLRTLATPGAIAAMPRKLNETQVCINTGMNTNILHNLRQHRLISMQFLYLRGKCAENLHVTSYGLQVAEQGAL